MFTGYTETPAAIQARMARKAAQHAAIMAKKAVDAHTGRVTLPAMTETQWWGLPAAVRFFHPIERATQPLEIVVH